MPRWPKREPVGDPNDPRGFEALLARYLEWLGVQHYSLRTIDQRGFLLRGFASWCCERGLWRPAEVTLGVLERYQRWLFHYRQEDGTPLAYASQSQRLVATKGFFRWLARERYLEADPASGLMMPRRPPPMPIESFSTAEVEQVLATPDVTTPIGLRDRALLETLYSTGVRRSELVALDVYDLDRDRGWLTVRKGKGGKSRVVPIGERALAWVLRYLDEARSQLVLHVAEWALFVTRVGTRFTADSLGIRVKRVMRDSGVRARVGSCHLFRHTCATLMLEGGADIRHIQEMLGHSKLETTETYTHVSIAKLKAVHTATHPAAKLERRDSELREQLLASLAAEAAEELAAGNASAEGAGRVELARRGRLTRKRASVAHAARSRAPESRSASAGGPIQRRS